VGFTGVKGASAQAKGASKWGIHTLLLNHGVRGLQGIYFFVSAQIATAGCMCSVIVYFLHCICVCDCDSRHESLIMLSHSVMVRRSHLLARCYLGTMCMCTTWSNSQHNILEPVRTPSLWKEMIPRLL
jgi:hypothetical protein